MAIALARKNLMAINTPKDNSKNIRLHVIHILTEQEKNGYYLKNLLSSYSQQYDPVNFRQLSRLVYGTLQWKLWLDSKWKKHVTRQPGEKNLIWLLRLGTYQLLRSEQIPDHAAISETVAAAKLCGLVRQAPFLNAVLRSLQKNKAELSAAVLINTAKIDAPTIAAEYSHPLWLVERWLKDYGIDKTISYLNANNQEQGVWIRFTPNCANPEIAEQIKKLIPDYIQPNPEFPYLWLSKYPHDLFASDLLRSGYLVVQNPIAWHLGAMLNVEADQQILDCCSAPGGKARMLVQQFPNLKNVLCIDQHITRTRMIPPQSEEPKLLRVTANGTNLPIKKKLDKIWLDAPCSNTGSFAGKPEVRWRLTPADFETLYKTQLELLSEAAKHLATNGTILFSLCSPDKHEGPRVVRMFLKQYPMYQLSPATHVLPSLWDENGMFFSLPEIGGLEGFFAARLQKVHD